MRQIAVARKHAWCNTRENFARTGKRAKDCAIMGSRSYGGAEQKRRRRVTGRRQEAEKADETEEVENQFPTNLDRPPRRRSLARSFDNSREYPRCLHLVWHKRPFVGRGVESSKSTGRRKEVEALKPFELFRRERVDGDDNDAPLLQGKNFAPSLDEWLLHNVSLRSQNSTLACGWTSGASPRVSIETVRSKEKPKSQWLKELFRFFFVYALRRTCFTKS